MQQYELTAKSNEDAQSSVQEALKQAQDYAEKSLLKNLDVYNVWTAQADLYIDSGYKIRMLTRPVRCWLHIRNSWSAVTP